MIYKYSEFILEYKGPTYIHHKIEDLSVDYDKRREEVPDDKKFRLGIFENGKYRILKNFE